MHHEETPANHATTCPLFSAEELEAALAGALPEARAAQLADHLDQCQACQGHMGEILASLAEQTSNDIPSAQAPDPEADSILARLKVAPPAIDDYRPGDYIGPYQVMALLGKGGSSTVYECFDPQMARNVAVKLLTHHSFLDSHLARHEREARLLARLDHAWIVKAFDIKPLEFPPYIVMELVAGGPSGQLLKSGTIKPRQAARLVAGIARAVQHAHEHGILHRDIKPSNLLVVQAFDPLKPLPDELTLKVSDFGLARPMGTDTRLTSTVAILGTPAYMSPEQARGRQSEIGPASDIYSIGTVLYEYLIGRPPLLAENAIETLRLVNEAEPIAPRHIQPGIPLDLDTICMKCLRKSPAERYATAEELAADLERFLQGRPILARPIGRLQRLYRWAKRNRPLAAALAGILVLLASLVALAVTFAIVQNDLRQQAQASATLYKEAAREAGIESDSTRNTLFSSVSLLSKVAAELATFPNNKAALALSEKARSQNKIQIQQFLNRPIYQKQMTIDRVEVYFKDADALFVLGFYDESEQLFRKLIHFAQLSQTGDPDHLKFIGIGNRSATVLGRLKIERNQRDEAREIMLQAWKDFPLAPDQPGVKTLHLLERLYLLIPLRETMNPKTNNKKDLSQINAEIDSLNSRIEDLKKSTNAQKNPPPA